MSDYITVPKQIDHVERAVLEEKEQMRYYLFTSVSTEDDCEKQQLHLYVYGQDQESRVQTEAKKLGMMRVKTGCFNWPYPRGDMITGIVKMEDFSSTKELETGKLTSTAYPAKLSYTLPMTLKSTGIIGDVNLLDQKFEKQLIKLQGVKFPHCPQETMKTPNEHEETFPMASPKERNAQVAR